MVFKATNLRKYYRDIRTPGRIASRSSCLPSGPKQKYHRNAGVKGTAPHTHRSRQTQAHTHTHPPSRTRSSTREKGSKQLGLEAKWVHVYAQHNMVKRCWGYHTTQQRHTTAVLQTLLHTPPVALRRHLPKLMKQTTPPALKGRGWLTPSSPITPPCLRRPSRDLLPRPAPV